MIALVLDWFFAGFTGALGLWLSALVLASVFAFARRLMK